MDDAVQHVVTRDSPFTELTAQSVMSKLIYRVTARPTGVW